MSDKKPQNLSIKTFLPSSLFGRSLLILVTPIILIQVITSFMFFDRHWSKMTARLASGVAGEIAVIAAMIEQDLPQSHVDRFVAQAERNLSLKILYKPGDALERAARPDVKYFGWELMVAESLSGQLDRFLKRPYFLDIDFSKKSVRVQTQLSKGVLHVSLPQGRLFSSSGYIFLLWMIGTSLILLVIAILFMRNQIRPIKRLAIAAERFGKGRDMLSFRPQGAREVRMAAEAFLGMHKRISRQIEQRTTMLAGVSHDLRTPLTRLKLQTEMLGDSPDVDAMKSDIQEMEKMIEGYLEFVRGEGDEQVAFTNMNQMLEKVMTAAKHQGLDVTSTIDGEINVSLRPMAFERCLINLVNNASKHAEHVWITTHLVEDRLNIMIEDNGPGIDEDQYEEVFRPFYRVDSSRNAETGGVGLGLPIAMDVVHSHGGKIWLERSSHGGLLVAISVPL